VKALKVLFHVFTFHTPVFVLTISSFVCFQNPVASERVPGLTANISVRRVAAYRSVIPRPTTVRSTSIYSVSSPRFSSKQFGHQSNLRSIVLHSAWSSLQPLPSAALLATWLITQVSALSRPPTKSTVAKSYALGDVVANTGGFITTVAKCCALGNVVNNTGGIVSGWAVGVSLLSQAPWRDARRCISALFWGLG